MNNRYRAIIPTDLICRPRWVLWRRELVDGRSTKIPYQQCGRKASVKAPSSWCTWTEAQAAFDRGGFAGVGFVFNGDGLVGVDFDDCFVKGVLKDDIAAHVAALDSYTEVSPSGSGLHVYLFGKRPPHDRRIAGIEIYETARFFCVTGQHLAGTPLTVNERQAQLSAFHAEVFAERIAKKTSVRPPGPPRSLPGATKRYSSASDAVRMARSFPGFTTRAPGRPITPKIGRLQICGCSHGWRTGRATMMRVCGVCYGAHEWSGTNGNAIVTWSPHWSVRANKRERYTE